MKLLNAVTPFKLCILTITFFTLSSVLLKSQSNIYTELYNKSTDIKTDGELFDKIRVFKFENVIYFTNQMTDSESKRKSVFSYDISLEKSSVIFIENTKETKKFFSQQILSIAVTKEKIIFVTDPIIFVFSNSKKPILITEVKNTKFYRQILPLNDKEALLYVNYNFHPEDSQFPHSWAKFNFQNNSIESSTEMAWDNLNFTPFANSWISTYKGLIAYSNTADYSVRIYNSQFEQVDSIVSNKLDSNKDALENLPDAGYSKDGITKVMEADRALLKRIQKTFLLDSNHVLVILKIPMTNNLELDLWEKKAEKWFLIKSELNDGVFVTGKKYDETNNKFQGFYGNINGIISQNDDFYFVYFPYMENMVTNSFDRKTDYDGKINNLVKNGKLYYGIRKIKILKD